MNHTQTFVKETITNVTLHIQCVLVFQEVVHQSLTGTGRALN